MKNQNKQIGLVTKDVAIDAMRYRFLRNGLENECFYIVKNPNVPASKQGILFGHTLDKKIDKIIFNKKTLA